MFSSTSGAHKRVAQRSIRLHHQKEHTDDGEAVINLFAASVPPHRRRFAHFTTTISRLITCEITHEVISAPVLTVPDNRQKCPRVYIPAPRYEALSMPDGREYYRQRCSPRPLLIYEDWDRLSLACLYIAPRVLNARNRMSHRYIHRMRRK